MRNLIRFFIYYFIFWLLYFLLCRSVFILSNISVHESLTLSEILLSQSKGILMDLAAVCYISLLPLVILSISNFSGKFDPRKFLTGYNIVVLVLCTFILITDISLFKTWGTKINHKALGYLVYSDEAIDAIASVPLTINLFIFLVVVLISIIIYLKLFQKTIYAIRIKWYANLAVLTIGTVSFFIGCRGGIQDIPINRSWVYYSNSTLLNNAALNSFWNFLDIISQPTMKINRYAHFDKAEAKEFLQNYKKSTDSTTSILKAENPNIVLILLESFSAENTVTFGGDNTLPMLEQLVAEGLAFTNAYATGYRTEQGLVAINNSFPAQPQESIMRHFEKFEQLPTLSRILDSLGYSNYYYYAGNIKYANTEAYLLNGGFKKITSRKNFKNPTFETIWGVGDEDLFAYHIQQAKSDQQPFFSIIMTTTNHEPFDAPVHNYIKSDNISDNYRNTVKYTDNCLEKYFSEARKQEWYSNTLFIITADHAHKYPKERNAFEPLRHKIPMLFYGEVLKAEYRNKKVNIPVSHVDIGPTILGQLNVKSYPSFFGNNIFDPGINGLAFYSYNNGFGLIVQDKTLVYDNDMDKVIYSYNWTATYADSLALNFGKAYQQKIMDIYIHLNN